MNDGTGIEIRIAGLGGQGVVLAGLLLGQAGVYEGWYAAGSNSYGAQARGSSCRADLVLSRGPIDYPHVERLDLFVALSQAACDAHLKDMKEEGVFWYEKGLVNPVTHRIREQSVDATGLALKEFQSRQMVNVIWVGIIGGGTGWFSQESLVKAVKRHAPGRFLDLNLKAVQVGFDWGLSMHREEKGGR